MKFYIDLTPDWKIPGAYSKNVYILGSARCELQFSFLASSFFSLLGALVEW